MITYAMGALAASPPTDLRRRLERLYFEQDLMVRNEKADRADLRHQLEEFGALKVFERIPFHSDLKGLSGQLHRSARRHGLASDSIQWERGTIQHPPAIPSTLNSAENPGFRLSDLQLAEQIPFILRVTGPAPAIREWVEAWREEQMRITEVDRISPAGKGWRIHGHGFRFREVKFPTLRARDPLELLPQPYSRNPKTLARTEPQLWRLVLQTRAVSPRARPLYRLREQLLLNSARMSFFIAHALRQPGHDESGNLPLPSAPPAS
jgi:hypothetical protein